MLQWATDDDVDAVIVYRLGRFSREPLHIYQLVQSLRQAEVEQLHDAVMLLPFDLKPPVRCDSIMAEGVNVADDLPDEIQRWTAKGRAALILSIIKGGRDLGAWRGTAASQRANQRSNTISPGSVSTILRWCSFARVRCQRPIGGDLQQQVAMPGVPLAVVHRSVIGILTALDASGGVRKQSRRLTSSLEVHMFIESVA